MRRRGTTLATASGAMALEAYGTVAITLGTAALGADDDADALAMALVAVALGAVLTLATALTTQQLTW